MPPISKTEPAGGYPPEDGAYLRGNDYSPVAVCVILKWPREETPPDIEHLVRVGIESGAALSGTLQTENIGLEKMLCNLVANPNIRYLILCGPESPGHLVGDAILALSRNGVDENKRIREATALTPFLFNMPPGFVERFRGQITVIDLINEGHPEVIRNAVWSCYQEQPVEFHGYRLHDPGAYPEPPLSGRITWRVANPHTEPKSEEEREEAGKFRDLAERIRKANERKHMRKGDGKDG